MINQYSNNLIPPRLSKFFSVPLEHVLEVSVDFWEDVIRLLQNRGYVYHVTHNKKDVLIGIQYQRAG